VKQANVSVRLYADGKQIEEKMTVPGENIMLPRLPSEKGRIFLGWNLYEKISYGFLNRTAWEPESLHAIYAEEAAYVLESYFREVRQEHQQTRSQFRRYVVDVYLENAVASGGELKLEVQCPLLYYLGQIPQEGVQLTVDALTNRRGGTYCNAAWFSTSELTLRWQSEEPLDAVDGRQKLTTLMLAFGKWGVDSRTLSQYTSDEILLPAVNSTPTADEKPARISANFYQGVCMEAPLQKVQGVQVCTDPAQIPEIPGERVLSRFAVLADAHVGERYGWSDYRWLQGIFDHLQQLHQQQPLDFVLQLGDNIDEGYARSGPEDYQTYLQQIRHLQICDSEHPIQGRAPGKIPHYEMQGNHDTFEKLRFFRYRLWYAGSGEEKVAFIAFFTNYGGYPAVHPNIADVPESYKSYGVLSEESIDFVEKSLEEAKKSGAKYVVLCNHFGIAQDLEAPILPESGLGRLEQLCRQYDIRLYLNGHEHNPDYTLRQYRNIYNYDASMAADKYAVFELREQRVVAWIYRTCDNRLDRIDVMAL